jgi:hypothetical protein
MRFAGQRDRGTLARGVSSIAASHADVAGGPRTDFVGERVRWKEQRMKGLSASRYDGDRVADSRYARDVPCCRGVKIGDHFWPMAARELFPIRAI